MEVLTPSRFQHTPRFNNTRTRSFAGCSTCRSRHVKCDEKKPRCSTCAYLGLLCGGYEKSIFFASESWDHDDSVRFRRPLLTEEERHQMSIWLTTCVAPHNTLKVLGQIDHECENAPDENDLDIQHGPFGAFKSGQNQLAIIDVSSSHENDDHDVVYNSSQADDAFLVVTRSTPLPGSPAPFLQEDHDKALPFTDCLDSMLYSNSTDEVFGEDMLTPLRECTPDLRMPQTNFESALFHDSPYHPRLFPSPSYSIATFNKRIPENTVPLLKHYANSIVDSLTACKHNKTPWHILFLPHARTCLAALALDEPLNHASLGVLYGMLAVSASSMAGIFKSQQWLEEGRTYKRQAREHIKLTMKSAYDITKAAKYKTILMALLTMVQLCDLDGNRDQTECYLLEAEQFIRIKGLQRMKSRKVRLLHHCYAFMRIFHESTFISDLDSAQRRHVRLVVESSGLVINHQDSMEFRKLHWVNLDQEMMHVKSLEEGENDLHLETPGLFSATLYPEIYGVPEHWVLLLSQVIRLANEKQAAENCDPSESLGLRDFMSRAKALERCIKQLRKPAQSTDDTGHQSTFLDNMLDAMQSALAIYFYRRIYDVDVSFLQREVTRVRDCLDRCEQEDSSVTCSSVSFQWPAFIAACEAEESELRKSFSKWFNTCAQRSGLSYPITTLKTIEEIWKDRDSPNGSNVTWFDLMKKINLYDRYL